MGLFDGISGALNSVSNNVSSTLNNASRNISSSLSGAAATGSGIVATLGNSQANLAKNAGQAINNGFRGLNNSVQDAVKTASNNPGVVAAALPISLPFIAAANANSIMGAGSDFVKGVSGALNSSSIGGSNALNAGSSHNFTDSGYRFNSGSTLENVIVNRGEMTGDYTWVDAQTGAYAYGNKAISTSHNLDAEDKALTLSKYLSKGWITQSDYDKAMGEITRVNQGTNKAYWDNQIERTVTTPQQVTTAAPRTQKALIPANNLLSTGIDTVIGTKQDMFIGGVEDAWTGKNVPGGVVAVGTAAVAETLAPFDLINVGNKILTGRGGELTGDDYMWALADAGLIVGGVLTGGTLYLGGKAVKTAAKNGKNVIKAGKVINTASISSQVGMTGNTGLQLLNARSR